MQLPPKFRFLGDKARAKPQYKQALNFFHRAMQTCNQALQIKGPFHLKFHDGTVYSAREIFGQPLIDVFSPLHDVKKEQEQETFSLSFAEVFVIPGCINVLSIDISSEAYPLTANTDHYLGSPISESFCNLINDYTYVSFESYNEYYHSDSWGDEGKKLSSRVSKIGQNGAVKSWTPKYLNTHSKSLYNDYGNNIIPTNSSFTVCMYVYFNNVYVYRDCSSGTKYQARVEFLGQSPLTYPDAGKGFTNLIGNIVLGRMYLNSRNTNNLCSMRCTNNPNDTLYYCCAASTYGVGIVIAEGDKLFLYRGGVDEGAYHRPEKIGFNINEICSDGEMKFMCFRFDKDKSLGEIFIYNLDGELENETAGYLPGYNLAEPESTNGPIYPGRNKTHIDGYAWGWKYETLDDSHPCKQNYWKYEIMRSSGSIYLGPTHVYHRALSNKEIQVHARQYSNDPCIIIHDESYYQAKKNKYINVKFADEKKKGNLATKEEMPWLT